MSSPNQTATSGLRHTFHPATPGDAQAIAGLRAMVEPMRGKLSGAAARPAYDGIMARVVCPEGVTFEEGVVGTVPGWWVRPANAQPDVALVHFHGGWFNFGSAFAFQNLVAHIAVAAGAAAFVPEYRLAPENPFPAAPDDALACYIGLVGLGFRRIALVGDSAGGALALVTLATAHALAGVPEPVAAVALSPVTDLTFAGESWTTKSDVDPYFTLPQVHVQADGYLAGHDPLDPRASPLFGDLSGLPPIRIHVGTEEMLFDDSNRYAERAGEAGVEVELHVWEGMPHGFLSGAGRLAAAAGALDSIGHFLRDCLTA